MIKIIIPFLITLPEISAMDHFFRFRNRNIHYSDLGAGTPIVLLHGYLETSEVWRSFAGKLAAKNRVIAIDLPGHGRSDSYSEVHSMELMAEVVSGLMDRLDLNKIFLIGHSLGGYITLAFAELFPEKLSGYSLFHSHPFADSPEAVSKREREIKLVKAGRKDMMYPDNVSKMFAASNIDKFSEALLRSKEIASSITGEGIISVLRGMISRPSRLSVMEKGRVPCLWILGAMDNYINCDQIRERVRLPLNAEVAILKNSGHLGFIEEEEESVKILESFIEKLPR
jgi:pimeloyl-ACP methyl ester carboxylesterase